MFIFCKRSLICLLLLAASVALTSMGCSKASDPKRIVHFNVISNVPVRSSDTVCITGKHKALRAGNGGAKLERMSDTLWSKTFAFDQGENLEFNFNLGDFTGMALNPDGWIMNNSILTVTSDTTVTIRIGNWGRYMQSRYLRPDYLMGEGQNVSLVNNWKYHEGDNSAWASPYFNDSLWKTATSFFNLDNLKYLHWKNVGWFRTHLQVDSALWYKTIGMNVQHRGAIEIYYNGRLLKFSGETGTPQSGYFPVLKNSWEEFTFDPVADQVIAVRYENYEAELQSSQGFDSGFWILIMGLNQAFNTASAVWSYKLFQVVFTVIPLVLSFMHLSLFFFYRRQKQNLFYAICLLGFAGLTYFNYERFMVDNVSMLVFPQRLLLVLPQRLNILLASTAIFFGTLTLFSITYGNLPKRWGLYLDLYIVVAVSGYLQISWYVIYSLLYFQFVIMLVEGVLAGFRRGGIKRKGTWIILAGFFVLSLSMTLQLMMDYFIINLPGIQHVYVYGMLAFIIGMSLYLSYNFSYVNKDLEDQLLMVKVLSDKAIEQERIQASLEVERRVLEVERRAMEADDLRKTKELESARDLQLSLLPKQVPQVPNLEIACYMKTAAEVGGDYYDFHLSEDGTLTAVIGDATGHGLKAGNMVILAKGLFKTLARENDLLEIIHSFNRSIKEMNLYMLTMCMSLLRINDSTLEYVSAGMPPMQIFRKETGEVEELLLKGMPLGAFNDFPYKKVSAPLCHGDVLLIMSDGLHEMFNESKETYGMDRVVKAFKESADKPPQEIIEYICNAGRQWAHDAPLEDDMTVMVIRVK